MRLGKVSDIDDRLIMSHELLIVGYDPWGPHRQRLYHVLLQVPDNNFAFLVVSVLLGVLRVGVLVGLRSLGGGHVVGVVQVFLVRALFGLERAKCVKVLFTCNETATLRYVAHRRRILVFVTIQFTQQLVVVSQLRFLLLVCLDDVRLFL